MLVGASYGGFVAQQVATALPDRVERLVLVCTAGDLVEPDAGLRAFWHEEGRLLDAGDIDGATELNVATGSAPTPTTRLGAWSGSCSAPPSTTSSPRVTSTTATAGVPRGAHMPVTVIVGAHDFDFFGDTARSRRTAAAGGLIELDWSGHLPTLERPDDGWKVLLGALGDYLCVRPSASSDLAQASAGS